MSDAEFKYSHNVMEQIKIPVMLDGDLAATIHNAFARLHELGELDPDHGQVVFCGHTVPKLEALLQLLNARLDIENRPEE